MEPALRYYLSFDTLALSANDAIIKRRDFFFYRTPEELYDIIKDPACVHNLIGDKAFKKQKEELKARLLAELRRTNDPAEAAFEKDTPEAFAAYEAKMLDKGKEIKEQQMALKALRRNRK